MTGPGLNPGGPHSPEHTAAAGARLDDASRFLVYATMGGAGLRYPADVYALAASLYCAAGRIPQMCAQMQAFLARQEAGGSMYEAAGRDIASQCQLAADHLEQAAGHAAALTQALQDFQAAIAGLSVRDSAGSDDD